MAQVDEKKGDHGPMDYRLFWSVLPRCATETRLRLDPKFIQSKAMCELWILCTLNRGLRAFGGVGRLKSLISRAFTDQWIIGHFGHFALGAQPRHDKTCSEVGSVQGNAHVLDFVHSDRRLVCI